MIVRNDKEERKRTCASVRSSLSTQAQRVTAGSEAVETTYLRARARGDDREVIAGAASITRLGGQAQVVGPT